MKKIAVYDTTLRDGAQGEGVSFSGPGKIRIARRLDEFGIDFIEGGFVASNPKDMDFFREIRNVPLRHARISAFGMTRKAGRPAAEDPGVQALLNAETPVVTLVGKSWILHVRDILRTTQEENLAMIADTVRLLKAEGRHVIYDAEHFFDGYADNAAYALETLRAAHTAGADTLVLCDTNGGTLPDALAGITRETVSAFGEDAIGIHTHNDADLATANTLAAVQAGATHVQGTINGLGERTGNADLCAVLPNLELKMGLRCLPEGALRHLKDVSEFVYEMANLRPRPHAPFVGGSAFAHKAGMHVDGMRKNPKSFEHIDPKHVGNERRVLISELSGASNVFLKAVEMGLSVERTSPEVRNVLQELERLEKEGYEFEAAEASFKLLVQKVLRAHKPFFSLEAFRVIVEKRHPDEPCISEATVKLRVKGKVEHTVGEGDGPVDALNQALRKALAMAYPQTGDVTLTDYRVRILDPKEATAAKTRVLIESSDGHQSWDTVGVSDNIIEASWEALVDGIEYKLFLEEEKNESKRATP